MFLIKVAVSDSKGNFIVYSESVTIPVKVVKLFCGRFLPPHFTFL